MHLLVVVAGSLLLLCYGALRWLSAAGLGMLATSFR